MQIFAKQRQKEIEKLVKSFVQPRRYLKVDKLGEGTSGQVDLLFDAHLNRVVAVKRLRSRAMKNPELVKSFINEAKLIGYLDHPGVVSIFDVFVEKDNTLGYTMQYLDGNRLGCDNCHARRPVSQPTPFRKCVRVFSALCGILAHAHDKGVLHLDIKTDNIMVGKFGEVRVVDWGSARLYNIEAYKKYLDQFPGGTGTEWFEDENKGYILGTPACMSPEQTNTPRGELTPASDIFSTGILFYQMLTGYAPFDGDSPEDVMHRIRTVTPPSAHDVNPEVPIGLSNICTRMLEKDLAKRYSSFHEIIQDINEFHSSGQEFETRSYDEGEVIFREGDKGDFTFSIARGLVEIAKYYDGEKRVMSVLGPGEIVGELAMFSNEPRSATVTALSPTIVRVMGRQDVTKELQKLSPWVGSMITTLSRRFSTLNEQILKARTELRAERKKQRLRKDDRPFRPLSL